MRGKGSDRVVHAPLVVGSFDMISIMEFFY